MRSQGNSAAPQTRETDRQIQRLTTRQTRHPPRGSSPGTGARRGKRTETKGWPRAPWGRAWALKTPGRPSHNFVSFTSRSSSGFSQWILEKNSLLLLRGGGEKQPFFKHTRAFVTRHTLRKTISPEPNLTGGREVPDFHLFQPSYIT